MAAFHDDPKFMRWLATALSRLARHVGLIGDDGLEHLLESPIGSKSMGGDLFVRAIAIAFIGAIVFAVIAMAIK